MITVNRRSRLDNRVGAGEQAFAIEVSDGAVDTSAGSTAVGVDTTSGVPALLQRTGSSSYARCSRR